ncbi:MAG: sigma-70 family RNA polymerase sigma factor [Candidatus Acidiferrales bacterium]
MIRMDGGDAAQVTRALGGDQDAFRALVERHSRSLFRLAYRMTGNEHDAEEVVQEAFLRAYRRLDRFESRANFGTWLYRIGVNCSLDMMRKRKTESSQRVQASGDDPDASDPLDNVMSTDPAPDRMMLSAEVKEKVEEAMKELSPVERTAFVLRHFEGHSIEEIGKQLGLGIGATKNSVFRAVQKLRRQLEPLVSTGE